ncbi:hypothetical protein DV735_g1182, partial [Chaetothyriales sp. CBS 134920]
MVSAVKLIGSRTVSDATIGLSDGLTVPFALTAGLSTLGDARVVLYAGLAELIAGAISMGLGGYIAGRGEADAHKSTLSATSSLVRSSPAHVGFLMRFCNEEGGGGDGADSPKDRAWVSAITIALGYFLGGLFPLLPYALVSTVRLAFLWSVSVMVVALLAFGAGKTWILQVNGHNLGEIANGGDVELSEKQRWTQSRPGLTSKCVKGGIEMLALGGLAAVAAMAFIKLLT